MIFFTVHCQLSIVNYETSFHRYRLHHRFSASNLAPLAQTFEALDAGGRACG